MSYVFQCDRCGAVGEKHTTTVTFQEVRENTSEMFNPTRGATHYLYESNESKQELCKDCADYLAHVMAHHEQDYLSCGEKKLLLSRLQAEAKNLGDEGMKPPDIIEKLLDICEDAMTRQV